MANTGSRTLRTDLAALLADAGIVDVDVDRALEDDHLRSAAYLKVVAVAAASRSRDGDRAIVATILREPVGLAAKTAVVALVDGIALKTTDPAEFQRWASALTPEIDHYPAEVHREFIRGRIRDWTFYLATRAGRIPAAADLAAITGWMQRLIASESTSPPVLAVLSAAGGTKKIRNIAGNRARSRAVTGSR